VTLRVADVVEKCNGVSGRVADLGAKCDCLTGSD